ncbi:MAG: hypothetical protein LQ340_004699 [Diploschistes diacapsis]|nr:MAG: hypothetical protein LQ340_004699 [Diploschistes diacapsis]
MLRALKPAVASAVAAKQLAAAPALCAVDAANTVTRREADPASSSSAYAPSASSAAFSAAANAHASEGGIRESGVGSGDGGAAGGWSQVAAKAAAPLRFAPRTQAVGGRNAFVALGAKAARRRLEEEERAAGLGTGSGTGPGGSSVDGGTVVDDWEEEARREEREMEVEERDGGLNVEEGAV